MEQEQAKFVSFLQESLIPDLKESGQEFTAQDFERAVSFMIAGASDRRLLKQAEERLARTQRANARLTEELGRLENRMAIAKEEGRLLKLDVARYVDGSKKS